MRGIADVVDQGISIGGMSVVTWIKYMSSDGYMVTMCK